jgi:oligoribonuclease
MPQNPTHLIWIDLEMTGLDPSVDAIIEIAAVITDTQLNVVAEGPSLAIYQDDKILATMDDWNTHQHTQSGLVDRVRQSTITLTAAEQRMLSFIQPLVPPWASPICGNSICLDRRFLRQYMPTLEKYFHYRNLDVSTLKELTHRWLPALEKFTKDSKHLALEDIYDSIAELKYYRKHLFQIEN